jgi:hypothetical protein
MTSSSANEAQAFRGCVRVNQSDVPGRLSPLEANTLCDKICMAVMFPEIADPLCARRGRPLVRYTVSIADQLCGIAEERPNVACHLLSCIDWHYRMLVSCFSASNWADDGEVAIALTPFAALQPVLRLIRTQQHGPASLRLTQGGRAVLDALLAGG